MARQGQSTTKIHEYWKSMMEKRKSSRLSSSYNHHIVIKRNDRAKAEIKNSNGWLQDSKYIPIEMFPESSMSGWFKYPIFILWCYIYLFDTGSLCKEEHLFNWTIHYVTFLSYIGCQLMCTSNCIFLITAKVIKPQYLIRHSNGWRIPNQRVLIFCTCKRIKKITPFFEGIWWWDESNWIFLKIILS